MSEFKPMVKMETTEPTVELKLKKGGSVKKADGGFMGMPSGAPPGMPPPPGMPARGGMPGATPPSRPSMMDRRKAMMAKMASRAPARGPMGAPPAAAPPAPMAPPMAPPGAAPMKKGGKAMKKAEGGKAEKHDDAAQDRAMIKKAMSGKKFATGGVVNGQAGFKSGGIVPAEKGRSKVVTTSKTTKALTASKDPGYEKYATGGVVNGQGGYKKGGAAKKAFAAGGKVESGSPVAMPQGGKKAAKPIRINELTGVYKKGGSVKKMADGGDVLGADAEPAVDTGNDPILNREMARKAAEKASIAKENTETRDAVIGAPGRWLESAKRFLNPVSKIPRMSGAMSNKDAKNLETAPGKKRGGKVC